MISLALRHAATLIVAVCVILAAGERERNVLGSALQLCSADPLTGWWRDGFCRTDANDFGVHVVCAEMTQEFLDYTRLQGNDLSTPNRRFPGLTAGDRWCLCAQRWKEAFDNNKAPPVVKEATHEKALQTISFFKQEL